LTDLVTEEQPSSSYEPTHKLLIGTFTVNILSKIYMILYHRKIVKDKLTKADFMKKEESRN